MMAQVIANSYGVGFISVKGPQLLSSYLGESEKRVRDLFAKARAASPCVIFFDEIDAIATRRGQGNDPTIDRVINALLIEMDHPPAAPSPSSPSPPLVFVIAATNRPELIDPAILRPGRFDNLLYVPLPDEGSRLEILKACWGETPLDVGVDEAFTTGLAKRMEGFSGADIANVLNGARRLAVRGELEGTGKGEGTEGKVTVQHVEKAMAGARPSVSEDMLARYQYFDQVMQRRGESSREDNEGGEGEMEEGEDGMEEKEEMTDDGDEKQQGPSTGGLEALRLRIREAVAAQMSAGDTPQHALNAVLRGFMKGEDRKSKRRGVSTSVGAAQGEEDEKERSDGEDRRPRRPMISGMNAM